MTPMAKTRWLANRSSAPLPAALATCRDPIGLSLLPRGDQAWCVCTDRKTLGKILGSDWHEILTETQSLRPPLFSCFPWADKATVFFFFNLLFISPPILRESVFLFPSLGVYFILLQIAKSKCNLLSFLWVFWKALESFAKPRKEFGYPRSPIALRWV